MERFIRWLWTPYSMTLPLWGWFVLGVTCITFWLITAVMP